MLQDGFSGWAKGIDVVDGFRRWVEGNLRQIHAIFNHSLASEPNP